MKNWWTRLTDRWNRIIDGENPRSASGSQNGMGVNGVHGCRSAVERL